MPIPDESSPETIAAESGTEGRIVVTLDELLYQRRMTLTELAAKVDITLANLSILKTGKAKAIRFSTLEAICRELECQPGDLLGYAAEA
jgi:putative transcriptional regulator